MIILILQRMKLRTGGTNRRSLSSVHPKMIVFEVRELDFLFRHGWVQWGIVV